MQQFKSGDRVRRTGPDFRDVITGGLYIVDRVADGSDQYTTGSLLLEGHEGGSYSARSFELVASPVQEALRPFQIGDRVRMISENPTHGEGEVSVGDVGVVTGVYDDEYYEYKVDFPAQRNWSANSTDIEHESPQVVITGAEVSLDEAVGNWQNVNKQIKELEAQAANYIRVMRNHGIKPV